MGETMLTKKPKFLHPTEIIGLGSRYGQYPGPYVIDDEDFRKIFPGINPNRNIDISIEHVRGDANNPNLQLILRIIQYVKPDNFLELGTYRGRTALYVSKIIGEKSKVITVDIPIEKTKNIPQNSTDVDYFLPFNEIGKCYKGTIYSKKIIQIMEDSTSKKCGKVIDEVTGKHGVDVAFVDASHDYLSTKLNFERTILPRLNPNGIVIFDNYGDLHTHVGVTQYLTEKAYKSGYVFYWYKPYNKPELQTTCVLFFNLKKCIGFNWNIKQ